LQTFKLSIPLFIPDDIDVKETYYVELVFYGPKGSTFGQKLILSVKINEEAKQLRFYTSAMTMMEACLGTFDECVETLKKCNGDENAAV